MEKENLNAKQSIEIITKMIETRKSNWNENGHILRFWGWLILIAAVGHFTLFEFQFYNIFWTPWLLTIPGAIYSLIYFYKLKKKEGEPGFLDKTSGFLWWVFAVNAFVVGFGLCFFWGHVGTAIIIILLGLISAIDGKLMRFKPMTVGGIITNITGLAALGWMLLYTKDIVQSQNFIILLVAFSIILTNLIPGYILKKEFKNKE